jgi:hypothetical protein
MWNMHLLVEGPPLINPTAGIIYAAAHELYPIVGKFSFLMTDEDGKRHPDYGTPHIMFRSAAIRLCEKLSEITGRFSFPDYAVICDESMNPPELGAKGKLCVLMHVRAQKVDDYYSDRFILGRHVDPKGNTFLTVRALASSASHAIMPSDMV